MEHTLGELELKNSVLRKTLDDDEKSTRRKTYLI